MQKIHEPFYPVVKCQTKAQAEQIAFSNCNLAQQLLQTGCKQAALAALEEAIRVAPDYVNAYDGKATVLGQLGRYTESLAASAIALRLAPAVPRLHHNQGITLEFLGRYEEALAAHDRALTLKPDYAVSLVSRSLVLEKLGRYAEGLSAVEAALTLDPTSTCARKTKTRLLELVAQCTTATASQTVHLNPELAEARQAKEVVLHLLPTPTNQEHDIVNLGIRAHQSLFAWLVDRNGIIRLRTAKTDSNHVNATPTAQQTIYRHTR